MKVKTPFFEKTFEATKDGDRFYLDLENAYALAQAIVEQDPTRTIRFNKDDILILGDDFPDTVSGNREDLGYYFEEIPFEVA